MSIISSIAVWLACRGLVVLIKLFQKKRDEGILGFICMLYTYIWGWRNAKEQNLTTMMWIWTGVIIVALLLRCCADRLPCQLVVMLSDNRSNYRSARLLLHIVALTK